MILQEAIRNIFSGKQTFSGYIKNCLVEEIVAYKVAKYIGLKNPFPFIGAYHISSMIAFKMMESCVSPSLARVVPVCLINYTTFLSQLFLNWRVSLKLGLDLPNLISLLGVLNLTFPVSYTVNDLMNRVVTWCLPEEPRNPYSNY